MGGPAGSTGRDRYRTPLPAPDRGAVEAFWERFLAAGGGPADTPVPGVSPFGDTVELADELIDLVLDGPKRATASALVEFEADGEPVPVVGNRWIAVDGSGRPRTVLETTEVRVGPLSSVDDRFARDEGEGDRTRASWLDDHTGLFGRLYDRLGLALHPHIDVVFERFDVRYSEP